MPMHQIQEDTIAAIATPAGVGGIAIIRVSGPESAAIAKKVFSKKLNDHELTYGHILRENGTPLDEGMAVLMRAPRSYTREDLLEFHCHGSAYLARETLKLCLAAGSRPAEPGEFTKRAFLNGRIDLTRAQAVMDMISANSEASARAGMERLDGSLYREVQNIEEALLNTAAGLEAFLDYPDDDLDEVTANEALAQIEPLLNRIDEEISFADLGRKQREGIRAAIVGAPNAGKSTLFNALLRDERAIVSDIPGTTRDTISESLIIGGQLFLLTDTAGLREASDPIEQIGVLRARKAIDEADLILLCIDPAQDIPEDVRTYMGDPRSVILYTKLDQEIKDNIELPLSGLFVSALTGENIHHLSSLLLTKAGIIENRTALLTHETDVFIMNRVRDSLKSATVALQDGMLDCAALDIRAALRHLGEMTGTEDEAVIDLMFSKFCLGK